MQDDTIRELVKATGFSRELTPELLAGIKTRLADAYIAEVMDGKSNACKHADSDSDSNAGEKSEEAKELERGLYIQTRGANP